MDVFREVVAELFTFAVSRIRRLFVTTPPSTLLIAPPARKALPGRSTDSAPAELQNEEDFDSFESELPTFKTLKDVVAERVPGTVLGGVRMAPVVTTQMTHALEMVVGDVEVPLFSNPTKEFDSVIETLPYGAPVAVSKEQGNWSFVTYLKTSGWLEREHLVSHQAQVRPYFVIKEYCGADSDTTKRLRRMIQDEFNAGAAGLPLQSEEYAYYKLLVRGLALPSIKARPRQAGRWQTLFAGERGVHISVRPKTGSIMEYVDEDDIGHLAYIEAVFPDESISISEVGEPQSGYYNERILGKEVWQHLQPVFIQLS